MNNKYFTTVIIENNRYVGRVYEASTNNLVYSSKDYNSQEQAIADVRTFIITSSPPATDPTPPKTVLSTSNYTSTKPVISPGTRRCCGR